jgi:hypothetical protein
MKVLEGQVARMNHAPPQSERMATLPSPAAHSRDLYNQHRAAILGQPRPQGRPFQGKPTKPERNPPFYHRQANEAHALPAIETPTPEPARSCPHA